MQLWKQRSSPSCACCLCACPDKIDGAAFEGPCQPRQRCPCDVRAAHQLGTHRTGSAAAVGSGGAAVQPALPLPWHPRCAAPTRMPPCARVAAPVEAHAGSAPLAVLLLPLLLLLLPAPPPQLAQLALPQGPAPCAARATRRHPGWRAMPAAPSCLLAQGMVAGAAGSRQGMRAQRSAVQAGRQAGRTVLAPALQPVGSC